MNSATIARGIGEDVDRVKRNRRRRRILIAAIASTGILFVWLVLCPRPDPRLVGKWRLLKPGGAKVVFDFYSSGLGLKTVGGTAPPRTVQIRWWVADDYLVVEYLTGPRWSISKSTVLREYARLTGKRNPEFADARILSASPELIELEEDGEHTAMHRMSND